MEDIRQLSVSDLITRLHESVSSFVAGMENVVSMNRQEPTEEISELRGHILDRLKNGEEITDNRKLIGFLDLLSKDQAVLELVKDDAKDWLEIIETIEQQIASRKPLTPGETAELRKIKSMAGELKVLIREENR
jgi:hypothetical protein